MCFCDVSNIYPCVFTRLRVRRRRCFVDDALNPELRSAQQFRCGQNALEVWAPHKWRAKKHNIIADFGFVLLKELSDSFLDEDLAEGISGWEVAILSFPLRQDILVVIFLTKDPWLCLVRPDCRNGPGDYDFLHIIPFLQSALQEANHGFLSNANYIFTSITLSWEWFCYVYDRIHSDNRLIKCPFPSNVFNKDKLQLASGTVAQVDLNSITQPEPSATASSEIAVAEAKESEDEDEDEDDEDESVDSEDEDAEVGWPEPDDESLDGTGNSKSTRKLRLPSRTWNNNHRRVRELRGILSVRHHPYSRQNQKKKSIRFSDDTKLNDATPPNDPRLKPFPKVNLDFSDATLRVLASLSGVADTQADRPVGLVSPMKENAPLQCIVDSVDLPQAPETDGVDASQPVVECEEPSSVCNRAISGEGAEIAADAAAIEEGTEKQAAGHAEVVAC